MECGEVHSVCYSSFLFCKAALLRLTRFMAEVAFLDGADAVDVSFGGDEKVVSEFRILPDKWSWMEPVFCASGRRSRRKTSFRYGNTTASLKYGSGRSSSEPRRRGLRYPEEDDRRILRRPK